MKQLCRQRPGLGTRLRIRMAETIIFEMGEPTVWIFTSKKTGEVMRRRSEKLRLDLLRERLVGRQPLDPDQPPPLRSVGSSEVEESDRYVVAIRRGHGEQSSLKASIGTTPELNRALGDEKGQLAALQEYIGDSTNSGTRYRVELTRDEGSLRMWSFTTRRQIPTRSPTRCAPDAHQMPTRCPLDAPTLSLSHAYTSPAHTHPAPSHLTMPAPSWHTSGPTSPHFQPTPHWPSPTRNLTLRCSSSQSSERSPPSSPPQPCSSRWWGLSGSHSRIRYASMDPAAAASKSACTRASTTRFA